MAQALTLAPAGLWTDPNPLSAAPDGAMAEALNVVISRPGVVEPRPGLQAQSAFTAIAVDEDIIRIIPFEDDLLVLTKDASDGTGHAYWYSANDDIIQAGTFASSSTAFTFSVGQVHAAEIGGFLYVTCGEGVFRFIDPGDDTAERAGLTRPPQAVVTSATTGGLNYPLAANEAVAYRLCYSHTVGDKILRGPPSARILQRSYTGSSAKRVTLTFPYAAPETAEVYRSTSFASLYSDEPTDEMAQIGSAAAADTSFEDDVPTTGLRGASLYTNATQGGALLENGITPFTRDVAAFRTMLFFAAARRAPALTWEVIGFGDDWRGSSDANKSRMLGSGQNGTVTSGSNQITGVAAADMLRIYPGMRVISMFSTDPDQADSVWPVDTEVVSLSGTTVTVSENALANDTNFITLDWVKLSHYDGTTTTTVALYPAELGGVYSNTIEEDEFTLTTAGNVAGPQDMAVEFSERFESYGVVVSVFGDGVNVPWTFIAEASKSSTVSLTVTCSRSDFTTTRIDDTTGKTATQSGTVATLAWSKPGEPESCPPGYVTEIGASDKAIERVIAARDSLFVFKEDGVWRVSGYSPDTLQIDEFDRAMRLVHPDAACEWNGAVAAWTNKGVMLISDGGAQEISGPIDDLIRDGADTHSGQGAQGVFMCAWADREMLLLGIPASTSAGYATYVYCWSARTQAWTRWSHASRITCAAASGTSLYLGTMAQDSSSKASVLLAVDNSYDFSYAPTISAVDGTSVTIDFLSGYTPAVGDVIQKGGSNYSITAVSSATAFTVHEAGLTTGAATALRTSTNRVEFTVRDGENPGAQKLFRESTLLFGSASGLAKIEQDFTSDRSSTASESDFVLTYTTSSDPTTIRTRIPRESRRCGRLSQVIDFKGALPDWQFHGVSYVFEPLAARFRDAS